MARWFPSVWFYFCSLQGEADFLTITSTWCKSSQNVLMCPWVVSSHLSLASSAKMKRSAPLKKHFWSPTNYNAGKYRGLSLLNKSRLICVTAHSSITCILVAAGRKDIRLTTLQWVWRPRSGARGSDAHAHAPCVAQHGQCRATKTKRREKKRGGGLEEKELQLSSQTRTICLICVTCFLLIWEVCWRDLGVWERPVRAGPWARASLSLGSVSKGHNFPANLHS